MKLTDYIGFVKVKNISGGRIAMGRFKLNNEESKTINPAFYPRSVGEALDVLLLRNAIEATLVKGEEIVKPEKSDVVKVETVKNEHGEKREHSVYDPEKASRERAITVESTDSGKAIEVGSLDKQDAINFLEQHWKRVEKDIQEIQSIERLEYLISVAVELGMDGNKKHELLEDRILELK